MVEPWALMAHPITERLLGMYLCQQIKPPPQPDLGRMANGDAVAAEVVLG